MSRSQHGRRGRPRRKLRQRILVVTEGTRTEPQYIERLSGYLRNKGTTVTVKSFSVGRDPLSVVKKCIEKREEAAQRDKSFDICVCLVDVDEHQKLPDAVSLAEKEGIFLLISNIKFETWLRWHAENKRSALTSKELDKCVRELGLVTGKHLSNSFPIDQVHTACTRARVADPKMQAGIKGPNPSSSMPILVDLMHSF